MWQLRQLEAVNSEAAKAAADTYADCKAQLQQVGTKSEQIDQKCDERYGDESMDAASTAELKSITEMHSGTSCNSWNGKIMVYCLHHL
jgi:hypothetical protein